MKAVNHIAGGTVITGTFCSFFDVNIFDSWQNLIAVVFFSLLPDIDTPKSWLGRLFKPVAKYLDRNYGHRTITHSFVFLFSVWLFILLIESVLPFDSSVSLIAFFGLVSHFLLDMVTVQGIPLFYPFKRNPCVIPANPEYRIRTNDRRGEAIALFLFTVLSLSSFDLYKNGFWTTYNRAFGTLKHVAKEFKRNENVLLCDYKISSSGAVFSDTAIVVNATEQELTLFNAGTKEVLKLSKADNTKKILSTKPIITNQTKRYLSIDFENISLDSLERLRLGRFVSGYIFSYESFEFKRPNEAPKTTKHIELKNDFYFTLIASDSKRLELKQKLMLLENEAKKEQEEINQKKRVISLFASQISEMEKQLKSGSLSAYERNKMQLELIELKKAAKRRNMEFVLSGGSLVSLEIKNLKNTLKEASLQRFSGKLVYPSFDKLALAN